jgi:uncharacterized protein (DUF1800 family)
MEDDRPRIAHLLRRTGFGTTGPAIDAAAARGVDATLAAVLAARADGPAPPRFETPEAPGKQDTAARKAYKKELRAQAQTLTLWWLQRMVAAPEPFPERLTFFWHGHWATSIQKVRGAGLMLRQNETLRTRGRGDFRELARAMVRDPALLVWLDGQRNKKGKPNENLARELMELFTLGVGAYSETDVREAARALTGWRVDRRAATAAPVPRQHDDGTKTVLGSKGAFDDRGLIDLLVAQPASARFVATRLWVRFATGTAPSAAALGRLTTAYGPGRDVSALLRALFTDPDFDRARSALVASPVEYVVGVHRALGGPIEKKTVATLTALGQVPFLPPSVGGWPGGSAWLSTAATRARIGWATTVAGGADLDAVAAAPQRERATAAGRLLGIDDWTARTRAALDDAAADPVRLVARALVSPDYVVR